MAKFNPLSNKLSTYTLENIAIVQNINNISRYRNGRPERGYFKRVQNPFLRSTTQSHRRSTNSTGNGLASNRKRNKIDDQRVTQHLLHDRKTVRIKRIRTSVPPPQNRKPKLQLTHGPPPLKNTKTHSKNIFHPTQCNRVKRTHAPIRRIRNNSPLKPHPLEQQNKKIRRSQPLQRKLRTLPRRQPHSRATQLRKRTKSTIKKTISTQISHLRRTQPQNRCIRGNATQRLNC